jgi:hypothetical protein
LIGHAGALLGRLDAARAGHHATDPPHAVLMAGSRAMVAIVSAGAASRHFGDEALALLSSLLARLGTRLHAAESLDIPQAQLLALADEIRRLAAEVERAVGSMPKAQPSAGI